MVTVITPELYELYRRGEFTGFEFTMGAVLNSVVLCRRPSDPEEPIWMCRVTNTDNQNVTDLRITEKVIVGAFIEALWQQLRQVRFTTLQRQADIDTFLATLKLRGDKETEALFKRVFFIEDQPEET